MLGDRSKVLRLVGCLPSSGPAASLARSLELPEYGRKGDGLAKSAAIVLSAVDCVLRRIDRRFMNGYANAFEIRVTVYENGPLGQPACDVLACGIGYALAHSGEVSVLAVVPEPQVTCERIVLVQERSVVDHLVDVTTEEAFHGSEVVTADQAFRVQLSGQLQPDAESVTVNSLALTRSQR